MHSTTEIAQYQLDAYNSQDIENFIKWFDEDVEVYNFPNEFLYSGTKIMRESYTKMWSAHPNQKAILTDRISVGKYAFDKENVVGRSDGQELNVIAIYEIEDSLIKKVFFVRG